MVDAEQHGCAAARHDAMEVGVAVLQCGLWLAARLLQTVTAEECGGRGGGGAVDPVKAVAQTGLDVLLRGVARHTDQEERTAASSGCVDATRQLREEPRVEPVAGEGDGKRRQRKRRAGVEEKVKAVAERIVPGLLGLLAEGCRDLQHVTHIANRRGSAVLLARVAGSLNTLLRERAAKQCGRFSHVDGREALFVHHVKRTA